jgi:glycosyltransferase involved in cell wall biosynthesis
MPRLLIDGTPIHPNAKGVGRYAYHMCLQLAELLPQDWSIDVLIHVQSMQVFVQPVRLNLVAVKRRSEIGKALWSLGYQARRLRSQILFKTDESAGRIAGIPTVAICHDIDELIWAAQEEKKSSFRRMVDSSKQRLRRQTLRGCKYVLCNSEFIREAVQKHYGIPEERLRVAYCAVDERFYRLSESTDRSAVRHKYGIQRFILTFATGDLRENFRSYPAIAARLAELKIDTCLLVAGIIPGASYGHQLRGEFLRLGLVEGRHFIFEDFLGADRFQDLVDLYTAADFYLELSLHEGFGMQIVEAMACGTTCISSPRGALREIGDRYVRFVNPVDPTDVASNISSAYKNGKDKGDTRSQVEYTHKFAWPKTARVVAEALLQTLSQSRQIETNSTGFKN